MEMPFGVLAIYGALAVWTGLGIHALRTQTFRWFLGFGIALLLYLNVRYFIDGVPSSIAFFIGIYDVLDNLGLGAEEQVAAMATCANNDCSVWGSTFAQHPAWGVAFYERFLTGSNLRRGLLYGHIGFNTITFVLMHIQLWRTGSAEHAGQHRLLGRLSFTTLTLGVGCAIWLASEHGSVGEYGGVLSQLGFYSMSAVVYACAIMGVVAIKRGNAESHRIWMIRFAGSMWGSFWLFRVMLFVIDPILRDVSSAAILICIWFSAPLGVLIAEAFRRRLDHRASQPAPAPVGEGIPAAT